MGLRKELSIKVYGDVKKMVSLLQLYSAGCAQTAFICIRETGKIQKKRGMKLSISFSPSLLSLISRRYLS